MYTTFPNSAYNNGKNLKKMEQPMAKKESKTFLKFFGGWFGYCQVSKQYGWLSKNFNFPKNEKKVTMYRQIGSEQKLIQSLRW